MASEPPSPPNGSNGTPKKGGTLVARYRTTLAALSMRTGTALPALITSFAVLHEITAVVPLVGVFYACRTFGVGERVVGYAQEATANARERREGLVTRTSEKWMKEGEAWTERVGRRYGIWGFEKGGEPSTRTSTTPGIGTGTGTAVAGDVANALVAYCATKALLPARIGVSLYFAPTFARRVVSPLSRRLVGVFRRRK